MTPILTITNQIALQQKDLKGKIMTPILTITNQIALKQKDLKGQRNAPSLTSNGGDLSWVRSFFQTFYSVPKVLLSFR